MRLRKPIVATAVGGVPELVADSSEGYLVKDGDAAAFAARVLEPDDPVGTGFLLR